VQPGLGLWDELRDTAALTARALRRKLPLEALAQFRARLAALLDQARNTIDGPETEEMDTNGAHSDHHHHNTNTDSIDLEPYLENSRGTPVEAEGHPDAPDTALEDPDTRCLPKIPLHLVIAGCPSLKTFYQDDIRHWHHLFDAACHVRPAMGISASVWEEALRCMGPEQASIVVVAMLERFADIRSPGGYLRALSAKAAAGEFSCGPMVMALLGRRSAA
jgi:replication initiation protein RepC